MQNILNELQQLGKRISFVERFNHRIAESQPPTTLFQLDGQPKYYSYYSGSSATFIQSVATETDKQTDRSSKSRRVEESKSRKVEELDVFSRLDCERWQAWVERRSKSRRRNQDRYWNGNVNGCLGGNRKRWARERRVKSRRSKGSSFVVDTGLPPTMSFPMTDDTECQ